MSALSGRLCLGFDELAKGSHVERRGFLCSRVGRGPEMSKRGRIRVGQKPRRCMKCQQGRLSCHSSEGTSVVVRSGSLGVRRLAGNGLLQTRSCGSPEGKARDRIRGGMDLRRATQLVAVTNASQWAKGAWRDGNCRRQKVRTFARGGGG
ncbi:hypothetical protein VFPFJ_07095 [Purpureocillium lilacinum]|uniref:Uncharacterized protein n=1 Tax=Purpureocillium lilacinum TaxID=33203 RepID=A0A179HGP0_PURLI|nr:hypothetical protein VFPFJ_07095 [Purpureocillium lilacinum]OAQ88630.1 hypothetical protein VFPFJ_07095 [Purpureocillium lilacinum]